MVAFLESTLFSFWLYGPWIIYMFCVPRILHMFQLEGYNYKDYFRWLTKNTKTGFLPGAKQLIACFIYYIILQVTNFIIAKNYPELFLTKLLFIEFLGMFIVFYSSNIIQIIKDKRNRKNAKKKLVYTAKAKRLMVWNFFVLVLIETAFAVEGIVSAQTNLESFFAVIRSYWITSIFIALIPFNILIAAWFAWPLEKTINEHYISSAKRKLKKKAYKNMIKIGITGSYGKTSTKFILKTILSEKFNVLATPESYNTTMGNVRVIREQLKPEHEVFISEMGARYKHDIAEICDIVHPSIGIITSIGPQHLETFKTIDKIVETKAELINSLDADGVVILPKDNEHCQKLYNKELRTKYCYTAQNKNADVYAKDIELNEDGSNFIAVTKIGEIKCKTKLLGEHNIENILGCITIAVHLGLTKEQIEAGVSKIEPVPHRLQLINNNNGTLVIDDAFNSNPVGAKMALDVLKNFKNMRRIIITPGMVELGDKEKSENRKFGKHMAGCVDIAILVGMKRSEPIVEGLKEGKFDDMSIYVVPDLKSATAKLAEITKIGDVVLFENDLPDNYNE